MLPFSHDEVVYGKGSMLTKMPGDEWQKFANLRLVYSYMFTHPGTKLLFMGAEFGQGTEWDFSARWIGTCWNIPNHQGIQEVVKALNKLYKSEPALYEKAFEGSGFEWIDGGNRHDSILIYTRKGLRSEKRPGDRIEYDAEPSSRIPCWCTGGGQLEGNIQFGRKTILGQRHG